MIDSTWLSSFVVFSEELNFTRAAARLHISQPALHVQIKKLSEELGHPLYRKQGRTLELTTQGETVLRFAQQSQQRFETLVSELATGAAPTRVTLATGTGVLLFVLGPALVRFKEQSRAELRLLTRDAQGTLSAVARGEAHAGILVADVIPDEFRATVLAHSALRAVIPSGSRLARKRQLGVQDLEGATLILPPSERPHRQQVERLLRAANVDWRLGLETSGWEVMLRYVALGLGIALVNDVCTVPKGLVSRPFLGLSSVTYQWVEPRAQGGPTEALALLRTKALEAFASVQKKRR